MADLLLADNFHATPHRFLWHAATRTAVLSDLHLGIEASMARQGLSFPAINGEKVRRGFATLHACRPARIVIAGDLFDSPAPDDLSIEVARRLIDDLPPGTAVTILPGNHDPDLPALRTLFGGSRVDIAPAAVVGQYAVIHGHCFQDLEAVAPARGVIVGHQHPAIVLRDRVQSAKMICFARASVVHQGGRLDLLLLPTFSEAPLGTNLLSQGKWILDCPQPRSGAIEIAGIVGGQVLPFGPLANL